MNHGKYGMYRSGCRCAPCCGAARVAAQKNSERRRKAKESSTGKPGKHGVYAYQTHGCRCDVCREAISEANRKSAERKRGTRAHNGGAENRARRWAIEEVRHVANTLGAPASIVAEELGRTVSAVERMRGLVRKGGPLDSLAHALPTECSMEGCEKPPKGWGLCSTHYARLRKHGDPTVVLKPWATHEVATCDLDDCDEQAKALGYCDRHYWRFRQHGSPDYVRESSHGAYRYTTFGCRCSVCVEANRERGRRARLSAASRAEEQAPHGTANGYSRWVCRCDKCKRAWADYRRQQLANDPEAREIARARAAARAKLLHAESLPGAVKHGDEWTGPELEFALRNDLTVAEIASVLHRTTYAVGTARFRARNEPKYVSLAGIPREESA